MTPAQPAQKYERISLAREGAVAVITLTNPPVNAVAPATVRDLRRAFDEIGGDASVRAVLLTGGASRFFSAGADVNEFATSSYDDVADYIRQGNALWNRVETFSKPVVAGVNGFALGGGCELALVCDVRIAAESAHIGLPEITLGILPGWGGIQRMTSIIGKGRALEAILTGRAIDAREALAFGLVTAVVPDADLKSKALEVAVVLAARPPLAVAEIKRRFAESEGVPLYQNIQGDMEAFLRVFKSQDAREGARAFLEKRPPKYVGR